MQSEKRVPLLHECFSFALLLLREKVLCSEKFHLVARHKILAQVVLKFACSTHGNCGELYLDWH